MEWILASKMDTKFLSQTANVVVLITAAASAFCWFMSARAEVTASPETAGVGALLGGDIVTRNRKGQRIDLISTMDLQSKWNRYAAIAATLSAGVQCATALIF
jgi:hypothetical protein